MDTTLGIVLIGLMVFALSLILIASILFIFILVFIYLTSEADEQKPNQSSES